MLIFRAWATCGITYNLGKNKMEQQTPIPPKSRMKPREAARRAKTRHFPILDLGGRGVLGYPFILFKIVGPPKSYSPPFVFRDSICQIPNACYIFNGGIILTSYNTRSLGYTRATTWVTYLSTHNRTIPFRKANYSETLVNYLYGLTCDIDNTTTSVLSAKFV